MIIVVLPVGGPYKNYLHDNRAKVTVTYQIVELNKNTSYLQIYLNKVSIHIKLNAIGKLGLHILFVRLSITIGLFSEISTHRYQLSSWNWYQKLNFTIPGRCNFQHQCNQNILVYCNFSIEVENLNLILIKLILIDVESRT